jgi:hypothetical protein
MVSALSERDSRADIYFGLVIGSFLSAYGSREMNQSCCQLRIATHAAAGGIDDEQTGRPRWRATSLSSE